MESRAIISKDFFIEESIKENLFWLEILREHALFQSDALSPKETQLIREAREFYRTFNNLFEETKRLFQEPRIDAIVQLNQRNQIETKRFIGFKRHMMELSLHCEISISLTPSFINHMVGEANLYIKILDALIQKRHQKSVEQNPSHQYIELHRLFIPDSLGHIHFIIGSLDLLERSTIEKFEKSLKDFCHLYIHGSELNWILDSLDYPNVSAVSGLNEKSKKSTIRLMALLKNLKSSRNNCEVLATINPLIIDHMIREANYYLKTLEAISSGYSFKSPIVSETRLDQN